MQAVIRWAAAAMPTAAMPMAATAMAATAMGVDEAAGSVAGAASVKTKPKAVAHRLALTFHAHLAPKQNR